MHSGVDRDGAAMLYRAAPRTDGSLQYQQHVIRLFSVMPQGVALFLCTIEGSAGYPRVCHTIKATRRERGIFANLIDI